MPAAKMGRPKKKANRDTQNDLLKAAVKLFSKRGFHQVKLTDIANQAGVSIGLIRHYYGSKEGLIDKCTEAVMERLQEIFSHILDDSGPSEGTAFLDHLNQRTIEAFAGNFSLLRYLRQLTIENTTVANEAFKAYFQFVQQELNRLEVGGNLRVTPIKCGLRSTSFLFSLARCSSPSRSRPSSEHPPTKRMRSVKGVTKLSGY